MIVMSFFPQILTGKSSFGFLKLTGDVSPHVVQMPGRRYNSHEYVDNSERNSSWFVDSTTSYCQIREGKNEDDVFHKT